MSLLYALGIIMPKMFDTSILASWIENYCVYQYPVIIGVLLANDNLINKIKNMQSFTMPAPIIVIVLMLVRSFSIRQIYRTDAYIAAGIFICFCLIGEFVSKRISIIFPGNVITFMWLTHTFFCYYYFQKFVYENGSIILSFLLTFMGSYIISVVMNFIYIGLQYCALQLKQ